jgi:hypothetical protein
LIELPTMSCTTYRPMGGFGSATRTRFPMPVSRDIEPGHKAESHLWYVFAML